MGVVGGGGVAAEQEGECEVQGHDARADKACKGSGQVKHGLGVPVEGRIVEGQGVRTSLGSSKLRADGCDARANKTKHTRVRIG